MSITIPAGTPSSTPPIAAPCDSPKLVNVHLSPKLFIACKITAFFWNTQGFGAKMKIFVEFYKYICIFEKKVVTLQPKVAKALRHVYVRTLNEKHEQIHNHRTDPDEGKADTAGR
jgi:hypothetical protein